MKTVILSEQAPVPVGAYSQAIALPFGTGQRLVFLSGQIALDPHTGQVVGGDIVEQTRQVFANIKAILSASGLDWSHVVKTTVFLANMADFQAMNAVYAEYFPVDPPARSCVQVAALPLGVLVEIECVAMG